MPCSQVGILKHYLKSKSVCDSLNIKNMANFQFKCGSIKIMGWQPWRSVIWYVHPLSTPWFHHMVGWNCILHLKTMAWVWDLSPSMWTILLIPNTWWSPPHPPIYDMVSKPHDAILLHKWKPIFFIISTKYSKNYREKWYEGSHYAGPQTPKEVFGYLYTICIFDFMGVYERVKGLTIKRIGEYVRENIHLIRCCQKWLNFNHSFI